MTAIALSTPDDDDSFLLTFPLWFAVNPAERRRPFVELTSSGIFATPLFSDKDLVERFMASIPGMRENFRIGAIPDPTVLLQFLDGFQSKGFSHIAIDPSLNRSQFQALPQLRERIVAALKQSNPEGS